jgi:hypothetical protein
VALDCHYHKSGRGKKRKLSEDDMQAAAAAIRLPFIREYLQQEPNWMLSWLCKERGLHVSGVKQVLVNRLMDFQSASDQS